VTKPELSNKTGIEFFLFFYKKINKKTKQKKIEKNFVLV